MVTFTKNLGVGLYTPVEAAYLSKARPETFNRWFYGSTRGDRVVKPTRGCEEKVITFTDLMQAVAIRTLRQSPKAKGISLQDIRAAVAECERIGYQNPLASPHSLYAFGKRLIIRLKNGDYVGLLREDKGQIHEGLIIEPFLNEVDYDEDYMYRWTPMTLGDCKVVLDKNRRFGMPCIEPYGILASALVESACAEGSIECAADSHLVSVDAVRLALKYHESLQPAA